jgi:IK cytokine
MAEEDVNIDKMDMGSKKGPVGRWDFDTAEEYSDYMGQKEAMPKAAFQYGVKMNDGRKTRRGTGPKDEKQKLEREWQQISKIIESKRKGDSKGNDSYVFLYRSYVIKQTSIHFVLFT